MSCRINKKVNIHAAVEQTSTVENLGESMVGINKLVTTFNNFANTEDTKEAGILRRTARALKKVTGLDEHGLLIGNPNNPTTKASYSFIHNMVTNTEEGGVQLTKIGLEGKYVADSNGLVRVVDGEVFTDLNTTALNKALGKYFTKHTISPNHRYATVIKGKVTLNPIFFETFNNARYSRYLSTIGVYAQDNLHSSENASEILEVEEDAVHIQIDNMISEPVARHISSRIRALRKLRATLSKDKVVNRDKILAVQAKINKLHVTEGEIKQALTEDNLFAYFEDALTAIETRINNLGSIGVAELKHLRTSIDMINNAKERGFENRILTRVERQDDELMTTLDRYASRTNPLTYKLKQRADQLSREIVEMEANEEIDNESMFHVGGLSTNLSKRFLNYLSLDDIKNPIVKTLKRLVDKAVIIANKDAYTTGKVLKELYDKVAGSKFNMNTFRQYSGKVQTGNLIDKFSDEYWRQAGTLIRNLKTRNDNFLSINPEFLFGEGVSSAVRDRHKNEILDLVGPVMYDKYVNEAERLWDDYMTTRANFVAEGMQGPELAKWESFNSPVHRINNINKGIKHKVGKSANNKGSRVTGHDAYLVLLPRRVSLSGKETGFYDEAFAEIESDPAAFELYENIRRVFSEDQRLLNSSSSIIGYPPQLGYLGKSMWERLSKDSISTIAKEEFDRSIYRKYVDIAEKPSASIDPVTGKPERRLKLEFDSVPDVINRELYSQLEDDATYQAMSEATAEGRKKKVDYAYARYLELAETVQEEATSNLLESILIANHARKNLIHKENIELEINAMLSSIEGLVYDGDMTTDGKALQDDQERAKVKVREMVDHYMAKEFYNEDDSDQATAFSNAGKTWMKVVRLVHLGYSITSAKMNILQAYVANNIQALPGGRYSGTTLHKAYGLVGQSRYKSIMQNLYILGDVAYDYDKTKMLTGTALSKALNPMGVHTQVELINQRAPMIAMLLETMVTDTRTGEEVTLDSVMDEEGNVPPYVVDKKGNTGDNLVANFALDVRSSNNKASGDYHTHTLSEKTSLGKNIMLFLKFAPKGIADRFSSADYDIFENKWREGRYRSVVLESMSILKNGFEVDESSELAVMRRRNAINGLLEATMILSLYLLSKLLKSKKCKTEECREGSKMTLFALNTLNRLVSDIQFASPTQLVGYAMHPLASETFYMRLGRFITDMTTQEEYARNGRGYKKHDKKWKRSIMKITPAVYPNYVRLKASVSSLEGPPR